MGVNSLFPNLYIVFPVVTPFTDHTRARSSYSSFTVATPLTYNCPVSARLDGATELAGRQVEHLPCLAWVWPSCTARVTRVRTAQARRPSRSARRSSASRDSRRDGYQRLVIKGCIRESDVGTGSITRPRARTRALLSADADGWRRGA